MSNKNSQSEKVQIQLQSLPKSPGVYKFFDKEGRILYIGKATSLKNRVSSYFARPLDDRLQSMVGQVEKIEYEKTDSVLEALILEANLIKKFQPKYNIKEKDGKSFVNIIITKEEWPRVFVEREKYISNIKNKISKKNKIYGPYPSAKSARLALEIIRKVFPYCGNPGGGKECFWHQIGQCPGACIGEASRSEYKKMIKNIEMFLEGKKFRIIKMFKKKMAEFSRKQEFEKAAQLRNQIFALKHIQDVALMGSVDTEEIALPSALSSERRGIPHRIEAYDISNIGGVFAAGSMVVFTDGAVDKDEYRKFKIKTVEGANDIAMLREVLARRFSRKDWAMPDLILIDGGKGQINAAREVLKEKSFEKIAAMSIAKGPTRKGREIFKTSNAPELPIRLIENLRDEAHRFAIKYHRLLRRKNMIK